MAVGDPIDNGFDKNYFVRLTITDTDFPNQANVVLPIKASVINLSLINEGLNTIDYSFNGNTQHGDLVPGTPSESLSFSGRRVSKMWFRAPSGSSTIRIEAWG